MGLFKDLNSLNKTSRELSKNHDVKGDMASMQSKLATLNASMAQTAAGRAITMGTPCRATVQSVKQTGAMINFAPACTVELMVMLPGRPPMPVTRTEAIQQIHLARAQPGQSLAVRVMLDDPNDIYIDWAAP